MAISTGEDVQALLRSLRSAYAATPENLKIIDLYVAFAVSTALFQVVYMALVGSFPFDLFLSGVLSCVGTVVLSDKQTFLSVFLAMASCVLHSSQLFSLLTISRRIQLNKENKEFNDLAPERTFADFVLCNLVLHLVIMNFLG